jgi:glycosyltransferase involved in cell wall biosynthesis
MQTILFISEVKPDKYPVIDKHYTWYGIHTKLTFEQFSEIYHEKKPYAIYTCGNNIWNYLSIIFEVRKRWVNLKIIPENLDIIPCVFSGIIKHIYDNDNPLLSVITTTYNSKEKIQRPWRTLRNQTYTNWEWIVWDDSEDTKTYENLLEMQKKDLRMRVYRAPIHSGIIGEMKRLASGVAYGSFIIELDHDDEIHPELFQWILDASKQHKEADFFYCDSAQLYENTLKTHSYGDFFGYGYAGHANIWSEMHNQWIITTICAPPNAITLRHLVGTPNHIRVWKTEFYDKIGKHNPRLSVSDDYELLVKSYIEGKWCHIRACGYYQYRNQDGNFTFIRNSLIQHNVKHIYNHYKSQLPSPVNNFKIEPCWKFDGDIYPTTHLIYDPHPHDYSIILINPTKEKLEKIFNIHSSIHVYIIGKCPDINKEWRMKITWWDLGSDLIEDKIRYAKKLLVTGKNIVLENEIETLIKKPSINIITPCCRQDNLDKIISSINFDLVDTWYIIYDTSKNRTYTKKYEGNPKIKEYEYTNLGCSGNPQRNFGLSLVKDGFVYFLDDDNIIHPEFWNIVLTLDTNYFYTFDQQRVYDGHMLKGNNIKVGYIDTAQFIVPKKLINNNTFNINKYEADGLFIENINKLFPKNHIYIPKMASYYNYLEHNNVIQLSNIDFSTQSNLCKIMNECDRDNNYTLIYNELFKDLFNKNINLFELGNYSLDAWKKIFPRANVYGEKIDNSMLWNNINNKFDIIIDNGIHKFKNNIIFFEKSIDKLNNGGYYIIQDIHNSDLIHFKNKIKELKIKYSYLEFQLLLVPDEYDRILLIVKSNNIKQKVLAYYFPQYHSIPENNIVFGNNFTDWDLFKNKNAKELSSFKQPIQPPDGLGFYDPTQKEVRLKQAELAKKYGVDGFIYYHYWLENKAVMHKVLDRILEDNEPNLPFCLCFANDSWKHNYGIDDKYKSFYKDGSTFKQLYDNPKDHALYLSKLFNHPNYIKINNKPVLFVYKFDADVSSYLHTICNELKQYSINDIYVIANTSNFCLQEFDASISYKREPDAYSPFKSHHLLVPNQKKLPTKLSKLPCIYGGCMGWNSYLRHPDQLPIFDFKPNDITKNICQDLLRMKYDNNSPQIYTIFAWNEWTEGAIIEPNNMYGEELGFAIKKSRDLVDFLEHDNILKNTTFEFGSELSFVNITKMVHINCIEKHNEKWCIHIPKEDNIRIKKFGNPFPGIIKVIKIVSNEITTIYDNTEDVILVFNL